MIVAYGLYRHKATTVTVIFLVVSYFPLPWHDTTGLCEITKEFKKLRKERYKTFSLPWPEAMQIYCDKRKRLRKKILQLPQQSPSQPFFVLSRDDKKNGCEVPYHNEKLPENPVGK